jgi:hypothetical protein
LLSSDKTGSFILSGSLQIFSFSTGTMARILQRASQPVHPLLEPAKELRPGQQLERGWSTHQVKFLLEAYF